MLYLILESDQAITGCPIGMMDAAARCLERNDPALAARFVPGIIDDTGNHLTVAMFLTEKAGGSDVGANESVAIPAGDGTWRLSGEKWFASCAHSDLILVLARPRGRTAGAARARPVPHATLPGGRKPQHLRHPPPQGEVRHPRDGVRRGRFARRVRLAGRAHSNAACRR